MDEAAELAQIEIEAAALFTREDEEKLRKLNDKRNPNAKDASEIIRLEERKKKAKKYRDTRIKNIGKTKKISTKNLNPGKDDNVYVSPYAKQPKSKPKEWISPTPKTVLIPKYETPSKVSPMQDVSSYPSMETEQQGEESTMEAEEQVPFPEAEQERQRRETSKQSKESIELGNIAVSHVARTRPKVIEKVLV